MGIFSKQSSSAVKGDVSDFDYLDPNNGYFDSACQTLRPQQVIDALNTYYHEYNACGGRVKYAWGQRVDEEIAETRDKVLSLLGKSSRDYVCAFTLNTTYGLNLLINQVPADRFERVVTSDIEHNSVFLPTITLAQKLEVERLVLSRQDDGSLEFKPNQLKNGLVVLNSGSNIDGRKLNNVNQLCDETHKQGGVVIIDAAQSMGHDQALLADADFDAVCFSAHKMYGSSLGVIVAKKDLVESLDINFIGGGMVEDVQETSFTLTRNDTASRFEPGLQDFGGIIALSAALDWHKTYRPDGKKPHTYEQSLEQKLFEGLQGISDLQLINNEPSPVVSFYTDTVDAHRLAIFLSEQDIMARSGYFCCHYYLMHKRKLPPLLRISLGLNNTPQQIDRLTDTLKTIVSNA